MILSAFDQEDLVSLLQGELGPDERRRTVRRLLARSIPPAPPPPPALPALTPQGEPVPAEPVQLEELGEIRLSERARTLLREHADMPELLARLEALTPAERPVRVRTDRDLQSCPLCQRLIENSHDAVHADMPRAAELAELAIALSQELDARRYGAGLVNDLKARAWGCLAEVLRNQADLRAAEGALAVAEVLLGAGTGDVFEEARLLEIRALVCRDQRRLDEAHGLLEEVIAVYRQYRDFHLVGRAFVQKGSVHGAAGELEPAVRWLRKGLGLLDPTRERRLELSARHNLMLYLHESARDQEAWFLLKASRPEFQEHGGELLNLRLRWLEGKIQQALGQLREAEDALTEARAGFLAQGAGFSAALVCLDLAGLYAARSRTPEMRLLAEEMLPIFRSRDIHREAIAALIVFQQAVRMEKLSSGLLDEIRSFLRQARTDPKLRFEYSS
jgi:tetratricopeptide (TPR) repeat protein